MDPQFEQAVLIGDDGFFSLGFASRFATGAASLLTFGAITSLETLITAPLNGEIPLAFGFSVDTPWAVPERAYQVGQRGQSQELQWDAHVRGQKILGSPFRTHTTGILDYSYRTYGDPWSEAALQLVHPGRVRDLQTERLPISLGDSSATVTRQLPVINHRVTGGDKRAMFTSLGGFHGTTTRKGVSESRRRTKRR